jgi:hypothetical protein
MTENGFSVINAPLLMRRARMRLIATIDDPAVIQRILAHLGLPGARRIPGPRCP